MYLKGTCGSSVIQTAKGPLTAFPHNMNPPPTTTRTGGAMTDEEPLRDTLSAVGSFVSLPEAFPTVPEAFKYAPKFEFRTERFADSKHPLHIDHVIYPHRLLIDLKAVDASQFDARQLIRDCELLIEAARTAPEQLQEMLAAFAPHVPHDRILDAFETAKRLGLTEEQASESGGGFIVLLVFVALLLASCGKNCAHTKAATKQPPTNATP